MLCGVILSVFILASVPPVSRDALTHHLYIPKLYLQQGHIYEIPNIKFSYYPMNLDLLYMVPLYFKNDIASQIHSFCFCPDNSSIDIPLPDTATQYVLCHAGKLILPIHSRDCSPFQYGVRGSRTDIFFVCIPFISFSVDRK